ncbi:MAG: VOC family protein [Acidobacteriota bacterium]
MLGVKPYIAFKGNCEEAINFYKDRLGADVLFIQRYGDSPMAGKGPDEKIMHTSIKIGDSVVMACDNVFEEQNPTTVGNNISLAIGGNDATSAETMFDQLSEGGNVTMPMQETFWAERFGMLTDKFGINWMFNIEKPHDGKANATA